MPRVLQKSRNLKTFFFLFFLNLDWVLQLQATKQLCHCSKYMFLACMPRKPDTARPEPILPLCPNMPATLLETGQTTVFHGECTNPGGGFDQGTGESSLISILHCPGCHWIHAALPQPQPWRMWQQNMSSFSLAPLGAEVVKCNLLSCATHCAAATAAPTLVISEAITGRRQSPDILQRQETKESQDEWYVEENCERLWACSN